MDEYEKYLNSALKFLSFRPRSEKEVRENLLKKKAPQEIIERIVKSFKEQNFLDDTEFAKWWIEQRFRFRPKGMRVIELELRQKGISREIINEEISNFIHSTSSGKELQISNNTYDLDLDSARRLVEKKIDKYKGLRKQEIYQKLGSFLARRGFDWDTIKKSIDYVLSKGV